MSRFTLGKDDKEGSLYDLFAVANHSGTVNFGHYTAFGRLAEADQPIDGLKKDGFGMYCSSFTYLRVNYRLVYFRRVQCLREKNEPQEFL